MPIYRLLSLRILSLNVFKNIMMISFLQANQQVSCLPKLAETTDSIKKQSLESILIVNW